MAAYQKRCKENPEWHYFYGLPILGCSAVGGNPDQAIPLSAAWILYDLASDIFDDLQDQDKPTLPWLQWSPDQAMLVGVGTLFTADLCLTFLEGEAEACAAIQRRVAQAGLQAAHAQSISTDTLSVPDYFHRIIANTGAVLATITWAGARSHTDNPVYLNALYQYGLALGTLLQLWDDCVDLSPADLVTDLSRHTYTLPILYALEQTDHPSHKRLCSLLYPRQNMTEAEVEDLLHLLHEVQVWPFMVAVAKAYEQKALTALVGHLLCL